LVCGVNLAGEAGSLLSSVTLRREDPRTRIYM
jgi:hypothetical protein